MNQSKYLSIFIAIVVILARFEITEMKEMKGLKTNKYNQENHVNNNQSFLKSKSESNYLRFSRNENSFLKKNKLTYHKEVLSYLKKKNIDDSKVNYKYQNSDMTDQNENNFFQMIMDEESNLLISNSHKSVKNEFSSNSKILIAEVEYLKDIEKDGWHKLYLNTFGDEEGVSNSAIQCFAGGFLEGYVSWKEIDQYRNNIGAFFQDVGEEGLNKVRKLLEKIYNSLIDRINHNDSEEISEKKALIFCMISQLEGLYKGYNQALTNLNLSDEEKSKKSMTIIDFLLLNSEGNFGDLKEVASYFENQNSDNNANNSNNNSDFSTKENLIKVFSTHDIMKIWKKLVKSSHCSVILKLLNINGKYDIIAGHDTWSKYAELVRTLKSYTYEFDSKVINKENSILKNKKEIVFSSYPGVMYSGDDFYIIDKKTVLLQTTLNVLNTFIYKNSINIDTYVPEFIRIMTTNLMSNSAESWVSNFKDYDGHLYVTQWIVVDYEKLNKVNSENEKPEKIVYFLDDVPDKINSKDMTSELFSDSYLGSFNYPYFKETFEILGYTKFEYFKRENDIEINPRKHILKKLNENIKDLDSFESVISYNGYRQTNNKISHKDDISYNDPTNGIMSRYDLLENIIEKENYGGIDYKFVNSELVKSNKFKARSGPTYNDIIPPFQHDGNDKHLNGVPLIMKFKTIIFNDK